MKLIEEYLSYGVKSHGGLQLLPNKLKAHLLKCGAYRTAHTNAETSNRQPVVVTYRVTNTEKDKLDTLAFTAILRFLNGAYL